MRSSLIAVELPTRLRRAQPERCDSLVNRRRIDFQIPFTLSPFQIPFTLSPSKGRYSKTPFD